MNRPFFFGAALLAAALAACGGSGGSHITPAPAPSASTGVTPQRTLSVSWSGAEHSKSGSGVAASVRHVLNTLASPEPIAIGAQEISYGSQSTVGPNGPCTCIATTAQVSVEELDGNGSPVPIASAQIVPPPIATIGTEGVGAPNTQNADTLSWPVTSASTAAGSGTITVTADGITTTVPLQVLPNLAIGVASNPVIDVDAVVGVQFGSDGTPATVTNTANADVYAVLGSGSSLSEFVFPYGYQVLGASGVGISEESGPPLAFASQGTTLTYNDFLGNLTSDAFLVFATANGHYVYWCLTAGYGGGSGPVFPAAIAEYGSYKFF